MPEQDRQPQSPVHEFTTEPNHEPPAEDPRETERRDRRREAFAKLGIVGTLAFATVGCAFLFSSSHPAVEASLRTHLPVPGKPVEMAGAQTSRSISAELKSFSAVWIKPEEEPAVGARGERIEVRIPVSPSSCASLEAQIGGSCGGPASPLRRSSEELTMEAQQPFIIRVTPGRMPKVELAQTDEPTDRAPPADWSLVENASETRAVIECPQATKLKISLLPGVASPACLLTSTYYRVLITNERSYATGFTFDRLSSFAARLGAEQASVDVDRGELAVGGEETQIHGPGPHAVELRAEGSEALQLMVTTPTEEQVGELSLEAGHSDSVLLDSHEQVTSLLRKVERPALLWIGLLAGVALDSLLVLVIVGRKPRR
jgi:hypothetical protein